VDRRDLGNAIALNSLMFNSAVVLGPTAGGVVYAAIGPGWCFAANAVSFIGVIGSLVSMHLAAAAPAPPLRRSALADMRQGLVYVARHPSIRVVIGLLSAVTLLGLSYVSLLPAFASRSCTATPG